VWLAAYRDRVRPGLVAGRDPGNLFLSRDGRALEPKRLSEKVRGYVEAAGVGKPGSCHLLRHTAATLMLEGGADIRFIQAMLGHESLETTQIYTRVSAAKLAEIHAATHPARALPVTAPCSMLRSMRKAGRLNRACYPRAPKMAKNHQSDSRAPQERADSIPSNPQKTAMHPCVRCVPKIPARCVASQPSSLSTNYNTRVI
ncbi:MAG: tyrosine-type recombinase/integrase, partial [Sphingopyxis sp.]|nr:tyrosine-type recombinase/integrase [Sphingopyxis sp.]